ncbi:MAG TPA: DEAD/DEAH box helicase [Gammaproteobacteria bacterium]
MSFDTLGLRAELLRAVADQGYTVPTPIQLQAIPVILAGRDVLAGAQTGTGKTAGFTLPLLQKLAATPASGRRHVRALVLVPTRELAAQVAESVVTYGAHLPLKTAVIFGGVNINPQTEQLRRGVDIVVATPGRLLDHAGQRNIDLSRVEVLVLDEADRMLDMGFIHDIRKVLKLLPEKRQNLLFSATYTDDIRRLADGLLDRPAEVEVARRNAPIELVAQRVHPVDRERKRELLSHLVSRGDWRQVLVFTRTKHGANRLAEQLGRDGINAMAIHGNKSQGARTRALAGFKDGNVRVLVATDIAARGLDIDQLPHVVNFELPHVPEDYVHRIGRTGRAGREGEAISLVCVDETQLLAGIERLLKRALPREVIDGFTPDPRIPAEAIPNGRGSARRSGPGGQAQAQRAPRPARAGGNGCGSRQPQRVASGAGRPARNDGAARPQGGDDLGNRAPVGRGPRRDAPGRGGQVRRPPGRGGPGLAAQPRREPRDDDFGNRAQAPRPPRPDVDGNRAPAPREVPALFGGGHYDD